MKCDRCENEATNHEVMIKAGKRHERHLCESCAKAEGMMSPQPQIPLTQLLNQYITSQIQGTPAAAAGPPAAGPTPAGACGCCGTTLNHFRQTGLLGCPECYAAFEAQLSPLLQRAHEGGTHHVGKRPMRLREPGSTRATPRCTPASVSESPTHASEATPQAVKLDVLRTKLIEAVKAERYEEAAAIRDQIKKLESPAQETPSRKATRTPRTLKDDGGKGPA